jgi:MoaA/NifB/PqqE/SkfB family radical SAM enzyme
MLEEKRLHVYTNSFCNNSCLFCSDMRWTRPIPVDVLNKNVPIDLKRMKGKVPKVVFTLAEPTLNKNLVNYIGLAKEYGYRVIGLITNGRKLKDKDYCESLFEAGLNEIGVSFHGSNKKIHEMITRGSGSFDETFLGLCNLSFLKNKYSFDFSVNFLANRLNYLDITSWLKMMMKFDGLDLIAINAVRPKGQAEKYFDKIVPSYQCVGREIVKSLNSLKKKRGKSHPHICIMGMPPCLLPGYESNILEYEASIARGHRIKDKEKLIPVQWAPIKIKRPACDKCYFNNVCTGVWSSYIKKRGWKEFRPVLKA